MLVKKVLHIDIIIKGHDQPFYLKISLCCSVFLPYKLTPYHCGMNLSRFQTMIKTKGCKAFCRSDLQKLTPAE